VGAGLQGNVGRSAFDRVALGRSIAQGHDFGVGLAWGLGVALADNGL
jgi:hypothetical protein